MTESPPKIFMSYSHDSEEHQDWVLALSTRLENNGVHVILDQWDLTLGSDLPLFMEQGLFGADRVIAVCTSQYVSKANAEKGGVGYERMILTSQLMENITSDHIIPLIRNNSENKTTPRFLGSRKYIDFRAPDNYETKYAELIHEIHGEKIKPRPKSGENPFDKTAPLVEPKLSLTTGRYVSPATSGEVNFDFSNNNGCYVLGTGSMAFETRCVRGK